MSPLDNRCIAFGKHIYKCKMTPPNAQQSIDPNGLNICGPYLCCICKKTYHISFAKTHTLLHVNDKMFSHCI